MTLRSWSLLHLSAAFPSFEMELVVSTVFSPSHFCSSSSIRSQRSASTRRKTLRNERTSVLSSCRAKNLTSSKAGTSSVTCPGEVAVQNNNWWAEPCSVRKKKSKKEKNGPEWNLHTEQFSLDPFKIGLNVQHPLTVTRGAKKRSKNKK